MKIPTFLKTILFVALISISFFSKAQVPPGIVPANGIPVLVPATVSDLNTPNGYCQLSYGTSGLPRSITNCNPLNLAGHQTGNSGNSHVVITTSTYDSLACYENIPGQYLSTLPSITFWDTLIYGPLRVMQLGDEQAGSYPFASAASTYYFTPTEEQNLLFLWVAFVTEAAQHHDKSENGLFRIELTDLNGNYVTGNYYTSTLYVIPETTSDPILHPCCQAQYLNYSCPGPQMNPPSNINNRWGDWEQLVFDLTPYIGQIVKLRFIISECLYQAHYTYGYYTGFGANGNLTLQSCNLDSTSFQAPIGFTNYKWYINDVYVPAFNGLQEISMDRNTTDTLFKCEISLEYSDTIVFSKTVNYYSIDPDFTWEQQINNENYIVQFTNTSSLINNTNNMNIPENIEYLLWDFGDGTTSSEQNPIHYYSGIGPYNVTLKVFDNQNVYNESIYEQVLLSGVSVNEMNNKDLSCKAYPNPFNEEIILEVYNTSETVSFEIVNILGQVVSRGNINKEGKVRTHHFKAGLYFIKFMHGNQTYYSKLVKE